MIFVCMIVTKFEINEYLWANYILLNVSWVHALLLYEMPLHYMFTCKINRDLSNSHSRKYYQHLWYHEHLWSREDQLSLKKNNILEEAKQTWSSNIPTEEKYNQIWLCSANKRIRTTELPRTRRLTLKRLMEMKLLFSPLNMTPILLHNWYSTKCFTYDILFNFHNN